MVRSLRRPTTAIELAGGIDRHAGPRAASSETSLVAAAAQVPMDQQVLQVLRLRDEEWQQEAWRHFDICGEYSFVVTRHASALSRCRIYVAKVDKASGKPGKEATDPQVQILSETIFGGATQKAEGLRTIATQLYVAGEGYIVAEGHPNTKPDSGTAYAQPQGEQTNQDTANGDAWYVVSAKELRKSSDGIEVKRPMTMGGGWHLLKKGQDLLMRCWTPHPRMFDVAHSPTRAVLPTLREIERLTMLTFSQIDSRLISAGLLLIDEKVDFPRKEGQTKSQAISDMLMQVAQAQLRGAGTAGGLIPIIATVAGEMSGQRSNVAQSFAHIKFDTPLTAELEKKIDQAIRRLAMGLEVAPEDLLGQGDANHWSGWQIEESSIKLFIEPALGRICASLTQAYLRPALKSLNIDPDEYCLWYDTSELVVRPNRQQDALALWEQGVISDDTLRKAGAWDDSDKPSAKDLAVWRLWQIAKLNPQIIGDPQVAQMLGLPAGIQVTPTPPPQPGGDGTDPMLDEGNQLLGQDSGADQRALPQMPNGQASPAQQGQGGQQYAALLAGAEQTCLRALELAGGRLLDRSNRGRLQDFARHELHTQVRPTERDQAHELMAGAWQHVPALAAHFGIRADHLQHLLSEYCTELLLNGYPHSATLLDEVLTRARARGMRGV